MAVTDRAIASIQELIRKGALPPGSRLPPENDLAAQLGIGRSSIREAIKALELIRVLDVRHGDGTYVTSLEPHLLLEGVGFAIDLIQDNSILEVVEVRRLFEPVATGLAAERIDHAALQRLGGYVQDMERAGDDQEQLVHCDHAFHSTVFEATGNRTLTSILDGLSSRTLRARIWRGLVEADASEQTMREHRAIHNALAARDRPLAEAAALMHVNTSEQWLRDMLARRRQADADINQTATDRLPGSS
jgi:GntR family transcriptional regulator, transcriptional repressor for pyruvate dehydrogenase complex